MVAAPVRSLWEEQLLGLADEVESSLAPAEPIRSVLEWSYKYRRIDGRPFSLDKFTPLLEPYEDDHPHKVFIKPAQRGVSEMAVNVACHALEHGAKVWAPEKDGLNVGYVFPTSVALGDFSKERLSGLKDEHPHLDEMFGGDDWDAITFKQVDRSYLYLRGGQSEDALRSFACDVLILDEYDRMDPRAIALARRRLNASDVKREIDISTPSVPGRGIHAQWLQSDRRVYEQRCPHCAVWHRYEFHRDVRVGGEDWKVWKTWEPARIRASEVYLVCPGCKERLTDADRCAPGRWVAEAPEVTSLRGYWIPWGAFPFVDLTTLAVAAVTDDASELEEFFRSDLGVPYETAGGRVPREALQQLSAELPGGKLPDAVWHATTMGVDVGARFHYRISSLLSDGAQVPGLDVQKPVVRAMGTVGTWAELDELMATYFVRQSVVDSLPEIHGARAFAERHEGKVLLAHYPSPSALAGQVYRLPERVVTTDPEKAAEAARRRFLVQINRTAAMDQVLAKITGAREHWPAAIHDDPDVVAHLTAPTRVKRLAKDGQEVAEWVHSAPDHFFHACVYDQVARAALPKATTAVIAVGRTKGW